MYGYSNGFMYCMGGVMLWRFPILSLLLRVVCIFFFSVGFSFGNDDWTITKEDWNVIQQGLIEETNKQTPYVWGGGSNLNIGVGADCSGILFRHFRRQGVPVLRTTAKVMMEDNSSGWDGKYITYFNIKPGTLIGMTTQPWRPNGHIGISISSCKLGRVRFIHAVKPFARINLLIYDPPNVWYNYTEKFKYLIKE